MQQHINRGVRRHARMTGRAAPSRRELEERIHSRVAPAMRYNPYSSGLREKAGHAKSAHEGGAGAQSESGCVARAVLVRPDRN